MNNAPTRSPADKLRAEGASFRTWPHIGNAIPATHFSFARDADTGAPRFSTEISDLGEHEPFMALYDDACDIGFTMFSPRTGQYATWALEREHTNNDREITHWTFAPTAATLRRIPALAGAVTTIFND